MTGQRKDAMHIDPCTKRAESGHRGHVMVLVMISIAVAMILSLSFLVSAATTTRSAANIEHHASARQIAVSGLVAAIAYIEHDSDWYDDRSSGQWIADMPLLGGTVSVWGAFDAACLPNGVDVDDASFEDQTGSLSNPLFFPPMSGTIGGWDVSRAVLTGSLTGLTVPRVGTTGSVQATDGSNLAYVSFVTSLAASATFRQDLGVPASADTDYVLSVKVGKAGLASVIAQTEVRVYAGATLLGSSSDSELLTVLDLSSDWKQYVLRMSTDSSPPSGNLAVELEAQAVVGVLSAVAFDEVELSVSPSEPVVLTAVGRHAGTSHSATAEVMINPAPAPVTVLRWREP